MWTRRRLPDGSPGFVALHGGGTRLVMLPGLGGRIRELHMAGRQWLWHNPSIPFVTPPPDSASYVRDADSGGWDECAPTIAPCTVDGVALTDHGDLWGQVPEFSLETTSAGQVARCVWSLRDFAVTAERVITVGSDGVVRVEYALTNRGDLPCALQWAAHPLFPLGAETRLRLPDAAPARVERVHGLAADATMTATAWPHFTVAGVPRDLSRPFTALESGQACMAFLRMPLEGVEVVVEEAGAQLTMRFDGREIPWMGLWVNRGGWSPDPERRSLWSRLTARARAPYCNFAVEPCLAGAGALSDARSAGTALMLAPREHRTWSLTLSGSTT